MSIPLLATGLLPWARVADRLASWVYGPRLSILIFHRVLPQQDHMFPGEMFADRFDRLMGLVARHFQVLTLSEAVDRLGQQRLPAHALCITFDDGYADNATHALPILQRHGLRATFFVASGFLDGGRMWNDTAIELIRRTDAAHVDLQAHGLGRLPLNTLQQRRQTLSLLLPKLKYLGLDERQAALARLGHDLGQPALPDDLMMRSQQVQQLHAAGMEIGAHTVNHPILRVLDDAQAQAEIERGREHLAQLIDTPIRVFAYPNGGPDVDYDLRHVEMVRRAGFGAAVSTAPGTCDAGSHPFELPRFSPWDASEARWLMRLLWMRQRRTPGRIAQQRSETA